MNLIDLGLEITSRAGKEASLMEILETIADLAIENPSVQHALLLAGTKRKEQRNARTEDRRDQDPRQYEGKEPPHPPGKPIR